MTIKPMLDTRDRKAKAYPIVVYVYYDYQRRYLPTGHKVEKQFWDAKKREVAKHPDAIIINSKISEIVSDVKSYFAECQLRRRRPDLSVLGQQHYGHLFNDYLIYRAKQYGEKNMVVMRQKTTRIEKEFRLCFGKPVLFDELDTDTLTKYETWLIAQGNKAITRKKKFGFLSQYYKEAVRAGKASGPDPFETYKINAKPVKKQKLTTAEIAALENLVIDPGPVNDARNLFLFAYYCKGQRFLTCVTLQKKQVYGGRVHFKTEKGEKYISVKIHQRLQKILDYYKRVPGKFVLPYVKELPDNKQDLINLIGNLNAEANVHLKTVAEKAGITINLTFHIARHTFAFHLKKQTTNINIIQESLGHSDQRTTQVYLKELDDEDLDREIEKLYGK